MPPDIPANPAGRRDWAAIAHDYAERAITVPELCELHALSSSVLYRRINAEGWPRRSATRRIATACTDTRRVVAAKSTTRRAATARAASSVTPNHVNTARAAGTRRIAEAPRVAATRIADPRRRYAATGGSRKSTLTRRMLLALDCKMTEFETRMKRAASANATSADSERDARTLGALVRLFDKLKGSGAKAAPSAASPAAGPPARKDHYDADKLRHDLARRLQSLRDGIGG